MINKILAAAALCLACLPAASGAGTPYTESGYFTVVFPEGWVLGARDQGVTQDEKKVYGREVFGPSSAGIYAKIAVHYYAPGNELHKTPEKFIKLQSQPALGVNLDGQVYGKVKDGKAGNYYAKVFDRKVFEYEPKDALHPKKISIYEKFAVVPVKNGFFVLRYYAPMDIAKDSLKAYEDVLASFKPLLR